MRALHLISVTVGTALLSLSAGAAPVVPGPVYQIALSQQNSNGVIGSFPGSYTLGNASATVDVLPSISLSAHSIGSEDPLSDALINGASARLTYYYGVDGPLANLLVPLSVTYVLRTTVVPPVSYQTVATASLVVVGSTLSINKSIISGGLGNGLTSSDSATVPFNQLSGQTGYVQLTAGAQTLAGGLADAFIDPFIFIDPEFLLSNPGYTVIVSRGIGNVAPVGNVPGPATVWLLGTAVAGLAMRRRKKGPDDRPFPVFGRA